jgi:hypothetical protein
MAADAIRLKNLLGYLLVTQGICLFFRKDAIVPRVGLRILITSILTAKPQCEKAQAGQNAR